MEFVVFSDTKANVSSVYTCVFFSFFMSYEYYEYLSIERTATQDEIKRAYKKKAMELHPDRHGGDKTKEAEFKKVNEAYATLSDEQKKSHYDRF